MLPSERKSSASGTLAPAGRSAITVARAAASEIDSGAITASAALAPASPRSDVVGAMLLCSSARTMTDGSIDITLAGFAAGTASRTSAARFAKLVGVAGGSSALGNVIATGRRVFVALLPLDPTAEPTDESDGRSDGIFDARFDVFGANDSGANASGDAALFGATDLRLPTLFGPSDARLRGPGGMLFRGFGMTDSATGETNCFRVRFTVGAAPESESERSPEIGASAELSV